MILAEGVNLTIEGAVKFPGGYCHPEVIRDLCGEEAYKELLSRPRVVCEYDEVGQIE